MTEDRDDKISRLYQQMDKASPSALLDARIKKAAHQQVHRSRGIQPLRWLSAAALIVLSVGVVLRVMQEVPVKNDLDETGLSIESMQDEASLPVPRQSTPQIKQEVLREKAVKPAEKRQSAPAAVQSMSALKSADYAEQALKKYSKDDLVEEQDLEDEIRQSAADSVTVPVLKEKMFSVENWCGQPDLESEKSQQVWLARIAQLNQEKRAEQAQCLEQLMLSIFAGTSIKPGE